jgi:hypothetical protein
VGPRTGLNDVEKRKIVVLWETEPGRRYTDRVIATLSVVSHECEITRTV